MDASLGECERLGRQDAIWGRPSRPEPWWELEQVRAYEKGWRWATEQLSQS